MLDANVDSTLRWRDRVDAYLQPAKMWINGLNACKPLLHLHTQANVELPWSEIDMDFMNLNQAAHGDREFGLRPDPLGGLAQDRRRSRVRPFRRANGSAPGAGRPAAGPRCAIVRLARFGDNMRDVAVTEGDKVEAELASGVSVNTYGVNDLVELGRRSDRRDATAWWPSTTTVRRRARSSGPAVSGMSRCGTALGSRVGVATFLEDGGFTAFTTNFEDLGGLRQLPGLAVQRLMADGYGFGGEGDWKTAALLRVLKVMSEGRPAAPPSWRTTPTTWSGRASASSALTCSRSAPRSPPAGPRSRSIRWDR